MTALLTFIGIVLFVAGILISVGLHELGHMVPAKAFGMKVTQFFVGFGRTVWSTKRGETEYGIKAIPAGGFVRIIGMMPPSKNIEDPTEPLRVRKANTGPIQSMVENARSAEYETIDPKDNGRLFYQKVWWKKLIVMASGPLVNVVIAFVLFGGLFMLYGANVAQTTVATVTDCVIPASQATADRKCEPGDQVSPAKTAGFQVGRPDRVVQRHHDHQLGPAHPADPGEHRPDRDDRCRAQRSAEDPGDEHDHQPGPRRGRFGQDRLGRASSASRRR